jgi:hypothetical protein
MPYVTRNSEGAITSLLRDAPSAGAEFFALDHPDVSAFLGTSGDEGSAASMPTSCA